MSGYCGICNKKGHKSATCHARKFDYSSQFEMHSDKGFSRPLRAHVKADMAVYEPASKYLHEFQAAKQSLGHETRDINGKPTRTQVLGRRWLQEKTGGVLSTDTHVDHVIPYAQGGAHSSENATLLRGPANQSKGAQLSFESVLQAGGVKAAARAIYVSAHQGNMGYGKYTGGVPAPTTFYYPYESLKNNDGLNLARNEAILRDMLRAQRQSLRASAQQHYRIAGITYTKKGAVDKRCSAYRRGDLLLTKKGQVDGRCKAARNAEREKK